MNNILNDLIYKINLPAVQIYILKILWKSFLCCIHIKTYHFSDKFSQWLSAQFCFIILFCTKLAPENFFQFSYIFFCKWLILFQLSYYMVILMLSDIIFYPYFIIFQIIVFQFCFFPFRWKNFVCKIGHIFIPALIRNILHKISQIFPDIFKFIDSCIFHIICMQNLIDQLCLCLNLRYICHSGNSGNLF